VKFIIVSEKKSVPISGGGMLEISELVQYWMEHLNLGYRMVDTCGGYVSGDGSYVHERSYEMTVNAPTNALSKLKLLARCIARLASQEEVWIEYGRKTLKITKTYKLEEGRRRSRKWR
jgi:hypothetical protein